LVPRIAAGVTDLAIVAAVFGIFLVTTYLEMPENFIPDRRVLGATVFVTSRLSRARRLLDEDSGRSEEILKGLQGSFSGSRAKHGRHCRGLSELSAGGDP
jgi:hypothetical protein